MFSFVQVSGYLGTLKKSQEKKSAFGKLPRIQRGPQGIQEGAWRGPALGRATCPPGWVPHPLVTYLGPYLFYRHRNPRTEVTFPIYVAEPPQPSVLLPES